MKSRFLPIQNEDSIVNYYVLPLVNLSKKEFGDNFISAKLNRAGNMVYVQLKEDVYPDLIYSNKFEHSGFVFLAFSIPEVFAYDIYLIMMGHYSQLSKNAKVMIIRNSGLHYNLRKGNNLYTSKLIFALNKDEDLKKYMFDLLKSDIPHYNPPLLAELDSVDLTERLDDTDFIDNF